MKKQIIQILVLVMIFTNVNITKAQQWNSNTNNSINNTNTGTVGIGTATPNTNAKLEVNGTVYIGSTNNKLKMSEWNPGVGVWIDIPVVPGIPSGIGSGGLGQNAWIAYAGSATQWFRNSAAGDLCYRNTPGSLLFGNSGGNAAMMIKNNNVGIDCDPGLTNLKVYQSANPLFEVASDHGNLQFGMAASAGSFASGAIAGDAVLRQIGGSSNILLSIPNNNNDGNTYIGINDEANGVWCKFTNNKTLRVNGTIYATAVNVQSNVWADYVFKPTYKLMPLNQVEQYVNTTSHLPEMPSSEEVSKNGVSVGDMQNKLLQKVEELTLYVIEQQKEINELKKELNQQ